MLDLNLIEINVQDLSRIAILQFPIPLNIINANSTFFFYISRKFSHICEQWQAEMFDLKLFIYTSLHNVHTGPRYTILD